MAKIIKKYFFTLLVALSATSHSLAYDCSEYCLTCFSKNRCPVCYKRFSIVKGIDSACSTTVQPASKHCAAFDGDHNNTCVGCARGYALVFKIKAYCIPGTIQGCNSELLDNGKRICTACNGGYPSSDQSRCIPANQVRNAIPHCVVGGSAPGPVSCFRCEPGYTTDLSRCFKTPANLKGCIQSDIPRVSCQGCDTENGYFMRNAGQCIKNNALA